MAKATSQAPETQPTDSAFPDDSKRLAIWLMATAALLVAGAGFLLWVFMAAVPSGGLF